MSLQRYDSVGWDLMDESPTGEFVRLEDIIKLLEEHAHPEADADYLIECDLCERYYGVGLAIALIEGENK